MEAYALTDVGQKRSMNQDSVYARTKSIGSLENLFIVADGMGGHQAGDFASNFVVENLVRFFETPYPERDVHGILKEGIRKVNRDLYECTSRDPKLNGAGSTLVLATIKGSVLYVANIGDSRLYRIHGGRIRQVTKDHSYVEEMVARGKMVRGSADYNRRKNIITRAMGIGTHVEADFFEADLESGDYILLCSDGLTNMVADERICAIISEPGTLKEKAERLIEEANESGGIDNIAVVLVKFEEGGTGLC